MVRSKRKIRRVKDRGRRRIFIAASFALLFAAAVFIVWQNVPPSRRPKLSTARFSIPHSSSPRLALIIDDGGYNSEDMKGMMGMGKPMTFAILPNAPHAREAALMAHREGSEVILHLPMEPKDADKYSLERNTLRAGMNKERLQKIVGDSLKQVPYARGVNNHMGSHATEDPRLMQALMEVLQEKDLYFIDSHTSPRSVGPDMARKAGVASGVNAKFIDHEKNVEAIKEALRLVMRKAKQEGKAVAIGHPHPYTAQAIREMLPEIAAEGIRLVLASEVVG